ncbi:MAG TPA: flagellar filament capping protein FliD [Thioalkalivibrio sp.]|nr:flagellar filament capping protein FliD [Thioalkalivibrio sp.]
MSISSLGIGSGLDLSGLVDQMLAAERQPKQQRLDNRQADIEARLSAYGSMRSNLITLESAMNRLAGMDEGRTASSSDSGRLGVVASETASPDRYSIEIKNLASAQSLASQGVADADTALGTGTLTLTVGEGEAVNITIDSTNNTLRGVRDAINESGAGAQASIVNDGSGARLVLTSGQTGAANTISLTVNDSDGYNTDMSGLSRLASSNMEETSAAGDAQVVINGLTVTSATNTLDNTIEGMSFDLKGTTEPGSNITVEVGQDREAIRNRMTGFIEAYNTVIDQVNELTKYDPETREAALMLGDSTVRGIRSRLSAGLSQAGGTMGGTFTHLVNLGVNSDETGKLSLDTGAFDRAMNQDLPNVVSLLNDVAGGMSRTVRGFTEIGGLLDVRTDGLRNGIGDIARQREQLDTRMATMEARLVRQFGAMDALVGQMQKTSQYLDQQLGSLNAMQGQNRGR